MYFYQNQYCTVYFLLLDQIYLLKFSARTGIEMMRARNVVDETPEAKDCDKEQHFLVKDCFNSETGAFLSRNKV